GLQSAFDVDTSRKKFVLRESGRLLRTFKTQLSTKWLRDLEGNVNEHPPKKYAVIITDEDWRAFIDKHVEEQFLVIWSLFITECENLNIKFQFNGIYTFILCLLRK